jgi:NADH pyrophosphatase NudC (nudix superfamily)
MEILYKKDESRTEDFAKRNNFINKINERGYALIKEAEWLMKFDNEMRLCNTCGKSLTEAKTWRTIRVAGKRTELNVGLVENCFACEMRDIIAKGDRGEL